MRILVLSDSHGDVLSCKMAIKKHPEAGVLIHLGDGEEDLDELGCLLEGKQIFRVRGNSIRSDMLGFPISMTQKIEGKTIYFSHGYTENVKLGIDRLLQRAREAGAQIALYGHTHTQYGGYEEGLYIMNPGSVRNGRYGVLDISGANIVSLLMLLD